MNIRRAFLKSGMLGGAALLAGGALWWQAEPAQAQAPWNTSLVAVTGTVTGTPESVAFSGTATISTRVALDPDFGDHKLVMSIDLTGVSGVGASSSKTYVIQGPEIVQKPLAASYEIDLTFPFFESGTLGTTEARPGRALFALSIDPATGAVTSALVRVDSPAL